MEACKLLDSQIKDIHKWMVKNSIQTNMTHTIKEYLLAWKYSLNASQELTLNQMLQQATRVQHQICWKPFIEGIWSVQWRECQEHHLAKINSLKSAILWLSKIQRRIWLIVQQMQEHWNNELHKKNQSFHPTVASSLKDEITQQWEEGLTNLPEQYSNLFQGSLETKLLADCFPQQAWMHTIWSARHRMVSNYLVILQVSVMRHFVWNFQNGKQKLCLYIKIAEHSGL